MKDTGKTGTDVSSAEQEKVMKLLSTGQMEVFIDSARIC